MGLSLRLLFLFFFNTEEVEWKGEKMIGEGGGGC